MKRFALWVIPALALMTGPALSQLQQQQAPTAKAGPTIIAAQEEGQMRAERLLGAKVRSGSGKDAQEIGVIQDLLFDRNNNLVAAVIGVGGFLGMGEKMIAVSWDSLEKVEQNGTVAFIAKHPREQLEGAPAFKTTEAQKAELARQRRLEQQQQMRPLAPEQPARTR